MSFIISAAFSTMISRSGTPPKSESGVGLDAVHEYSDYCVLFQAEDVAEPVSPPFSCSHHDVRVGSRASSKLVRFIILESIFDIVPFIARRVCAVSFLDSHP